MTPPHSRSASRGAHHRPARALIAGIAVVGLLLSGCGGGRGEKEKKSSSATATTSPSVSLPTGNVKIPDGVTLTKAGTTLGFGQAAVVAYEPNTQRSSVLSLSVDSVQTGRISDFAAYQLDARTKASRPYFVRVTVKNIGTGDLSRSAVPLLAVDTRNTLVQPSSFNNTFAKCPSTPQPAGFVGTKTASLCLVYLVPGGGTLTQMSFRPLQAFEPIVWKGAIKPAVIKKKQTKNKKKKAKN